MDINRGNLEILFQDFSNQFAEGFEAGGETSVLEQLAMVLPSTGSSTVHAWLKQIPGMREWIGDRKVRSIESNSQQITNKKYEGTIEIEREEIEDDQHGLYRPLARNMGTEARNHPDELCVDELVGDPTWLGDSAAFFGTSRVYGSSAIVNKTTSALSETTFNTAVEKMMAYQGDNGKPLKVMPYALLVGPKLRTTAFDICVNDTRGVIAADASTYIAAQNANKGLVTPVVSSRLVGTYDDYWFLLGQMGSIRGVVYQQRIAAEFQDQRATDDSDFVFQNDAYQMGVRARGRAFLGAPHLIYGGYVA